MYLLRSAPCFRSSVLCEFNKCLCSIVSTITNVSMSVSDVAWKQATLPVWAGGLGFRSAVQLAPSAFLASAMAATPIFQSILHCSSSVVPEVDCALTHWFVSDSLTPPVGDDAHLQRAWDIPHIKSTLNSLLEVDHAPTKASLFSVSTPESGAWLNALPLSAMGLRMDDTTIRVAVGLRLGLPLCCPHSCHHCGSAVDDLATHGLHCKKSDDRLYRHSSVNDILHRAFTAAGIPSRLEPLGLVGAEGRRPDGVTLFPWKVGKCVCWDFTCPDTLAPSYVDIAATAAGSVAALAEERKINKYSHLSPSYFFTPLSIETMGAVGPKSRHFLKELGTRIVNRTGDPHSYNYLMQCLSVAIQKSNMVSVLGSLGRESSDFIF